MIEHWTNKLWFIIICIFLLCRQFLLYCRHRSMLSSSTTCSYSKKIRLGDRQTIWKGLFFLCNSVLVTFAHFTPRRRMQWNTYHYFVKSQWVVSVCKKDKEKSNKSNNKFMGLMKVLKDFKWRFMNLLLKVSAKSFVFVSVIITVVVVMKMYLFCENKMSRLTEVYGNVYIHTIKVV